MMPTSAAILQHFYVFFSAEVAAEIFCSKFCSKLISCVGHDSSEVSFIQA
jgi:hypothetical protein